MIVGADAADIAAGLGEVRHFGLDQLDFGIEPEIMEFGLAILVGDVSTCHADRLAGGILDDIGGLTDELMEFAIRDRFVIGPMQKT